MLTYIFSEGNLALGRSKNKFAFYEKHLTLLVWDNGRISNVNELLHIHHVNSTIDVILWFVFRKSQVNVAFSDLLTSVSGL